MSLSHCFHCALPVPPSDDFQVDIDGELKPVCCPGCKAVAELIRDAGLSRYYAMRETPVPGLGKPAEDQAEWQIFDRADMVDSFAVIGDTGAEATVYVGKMYCAACSWLIETTLGKMPGVASAHVNPITHRLIVAWNTAETGLGTILATLARLGYEPQPLAPEAGPRPEVTEQRLALKRLLVASLGMMQVMMFAIGLYAGDYQGMAPEMQGFLRLVSFVVTTPVVFYSARPFFVAAWRGVISRAPGMDLPVSIAIGAAYAASVYAMLTNAPAVWFDSVTMFVFFLTLGRFLEMRARHRSVDRGSALSNVLPNTATRIRDGERQVVPVARLEPGDRLLIRPGEAIPADGAIVTGRTSVDEALLTGEPEPVTRATGDVVVAGSINLDGLIEMRVRSTGNDTTLGVIGRLSERARYARPAFVQLSDRIASYIVVAILLVAAAVGIYWYLQAPDRAFVITLSVLVVTCPCALALATPAAFAAAGTRLAELRLLVTNGNAIEVMSRATTVLFDKTGTLTLGKPEILTTTLLVQDFDELTCLQYAAALETVSSHPIASAFALADNPFVASAQSVVIGRGVEGTISGRTCRLGSQEFVTGPDSSTAANDLDATSVYLAVGGRPVARFSLADRLRPDAARTLESLHHLGLATGLVSGDAGPPVSKVAGALGISEFHANCTPESKLDIIRQAQAAGETVVMVGDGINDAPVLAGADASIAPSHGALIAQTSADIIMLGDSLEPVVTAVRTARQTMRVVRQNLLWAVVYNVSALPLAALGYVPPWAAAIGMSMSSLIVVLNALRLSRFA
ncbi:cadmium-translocating P-type ATPase [Gammaproteobacteria bacterium]|jgi:Cu2+-exporting ATPase|nr:cadmium-translocating P-type ATPase [Gammaproteobacteria bacterium]